jgi:Acetyltransferase (GNAT) domain
MATIRQLTEADLDEVSSLFLQLTPEARWPSANGCAAYLRELLFANPWRELGVPSWLAEDDGRIVAIYLLLPRRMEFRGRELTVAVGCQMSVHPDYRRGLTALQLAKAALTGPQDLTIADGAHEKSRDMWRALGGEVPLVYNLHWIRPLRPARSLLQALTSRKALPRPVAALLRPLAGLFDAASARLRWNHFLHQAPELHSEELDPALAAQHFAELVDADLRPSYDVVSLAWLLEETRAKAGVGQLRGRLLRAADGRVQGWFLYTLVRGGTCELLQLVARRDAYETVFEHMLADAYREGGGTVRGRAEPERIEALSQRHCWFRREGKCALTHSRHSDIRAAIVEGRTFLSRLEGEWWLRLVST